MTTTPYQLAKYIAANRLEENINYGQSTIEVRQSKIWGKLKAKIARLLKLNTMQINIILNQKYLQV